MKSYYHGRTYRTATIQSMIEWLEKLRFLWGKNAVISITNVNPEIGRCGDFEYEIEFDLPDGADYISYIREREYLMAKESEIKEKTQ